MALLLSSLPIAASAQTSAPSSHIVFDDNFAGDIIINQVRVPKDGEAMYTYYEALGWRGLGAGYAGIQAHPRGHNYLFSIWDNPKHTEPIKAIYRGEGTVTEPFGGEGTGLKSWNYELGWSTDVWYTLVARRWDSGERSRFGFWAYSSETRRWTQLVTMEVAVKDAVFEGGTDAFIEDWLDTGKERRVTQLRGGWKRRLDGTWYPFGKGRYSVNAWDLEPGKRSFDFRNHWNGGLAHDESGDFYFMVSGGKETRPQVANPSEHAIPRSQTQPDWPATRIESLTAQQRDNGYQLEWSVDDSSTPAFSFELQQFATSECEGQPLATWPVGDGHLRSHRWQPAKGLTEPTYLRLKCTSLFDDQSVSAPVRLAP